MINYKGTPLFGEDSNPQHTSEFFAIAGTALFWLLFMIFAFIIKPQPKKQYKEVQIVLSSTPLVQKTEESPAPAEAASAAAAASAKSDVSPVQPAVETPAPAPKVEKPVQKTVEKKAETPKPAPKKTETPKTQTTQKVSSVPQTQPTPIYKSNEELLAEQLNNKRIRDENYDPWANETDDEENANEKQIARVVTTKTSISGTGGIASTGKDSGIKSESQTENKTEETTLGADIGRVRNTKEIGYSESDKGKSQEKTNSHNDPIKWAEGTGARSIYDFDTELSPKAKGSMQVSKATPFTITFSVDPDGNVMPTTIEIKNEFILTDIIKKEMIGKISSWKFGKGSGISKARFDWILSPGE